MASNQLLGSRISLISKKEIRYEGILFSIDAANASVTLQNVKSWGTEDRVKGRVVPPNDEIFSCIVFRGADIKDLHIHNAAEEVEPEVEDALTPVQSDKEKKGNDAQQPVQKDAKEQKLPAADATEEASPIATERKKKSTSMKPEKFHPPSRGSRGHFSNVRKEQKDNSNPSSVPGMGNHLAARRTKGGDGISVGNDAFDFQAGLEKFDKDALREEVLETENGGEAASVPIKKYDKSSFFDEISCDATDGRYRISGQAERTLNSETFGATGVSYSTNRRNRGRGRGYRGRGGYRRFNQNSSERKSQEA